MLFLYIFFSNDHIYSQEVIIVKRINVLLTFLKGVLFATGVTIIGVAILALVAKDTEGGLISGISIAIKLISIGAGTVPVALKIRRKGAIVGAVTSACYWIICILLSLLISPIQLSLKMGIDLLLTALSGAIVGIITVNAIK